MCAAPKAFKRIGNRHGCNTPFFCATVIAMQIKPQVCRVLSSCALMLDDGHAGMMNTTVQDCRHPLCMSGVVFIGSIAFRAMGIGLCGFQPERDDLLKNLFSTSASGSGLFR